MYDTTALTLPAGMTEDAWCKTGAFLAQASRAMQWWVGDWFCFGTDRYGDRAVEVASALGFELHTLQNWASIARAIPPEERLPDLSWSHHRLVAAQPADVRQRLLEAARPEAPDKPPRMTCSQLRREVEHTRAQHDDLDRTITDVDYHLARIAALVAKIDDATIMRLVGDLTDGWRHFKTVAASRASAG